MRASPVWVSPAVVGYGPEVASMVVRAADARSSEVETGGGANQENLP